MMAILPTIRSEGVDVQIFVDRCLLGGFRRSLLVGICRERECGSNVPIGDSFGDIGKNLAHDLDDSSEKIG